MKKAQIFKQKQMIKVLQIVVNYTKHYPIAIIKLTETLQVISYLYNSQVSKG